MLRILILCQQGVVSLVAQVLWLPMGNCLPR